MTLLLFTTQCLPTLTLARSPLIMQSFMTIVWRREQTHIQLKICKMYTLITTALKESCIIHCQAGAFLFFPYFAIEDDVLTPTQH